MSHHVCACTHILNKLKVIFKNQEDIEGGHAFSLPGKWKQVDQRLTLSAVPSLVCHNTLSFLQTFFFSVILIRIRIWETCCFC